ncbi:DMT family transporter [Qipengyuania seohaensis]|uniref:DMT family transporter n=1 Tax=Qipengyuania seohaensis TaxID=266951 RepID=UPI000C21C1B4|nr:DMT family transporter [Qipengyuania seohaensis]
MWSRAYVLLTFTALFWAGNAIVARAARELVPPVALAFWRWTIALAIILPFAWGHLRRDAPVFRANWKMLLVLGALGIGAFNTLLYTGLQETTALNAMLLQSGQPALILFLGAIFMGDSTALRQIVGAAIALAGVLWIIARGNLGILGTLNFNEGDLVIGLALCLWAIYAVMLRHRPAIHPLSLFAVTLVVGIVGIAPFYALELSSDRYIVLQKESLLAIGYVSIFPSILAYLFFNRGVELIGSAGTGMYMNIMPIMGAGLAIVFLGEHLRSFHAIGMALIVGGILLAGRGSKPLAGAVVSSKTDNIERRDESE